MLPSRNEFEIQDHRELKSKLWKKGIQYLY